MASQDASSGTRDAATATAESMFNEWPSDVHQWLEITGYHDDENRRQVLENLQRSTVARHRNEQFEKLAQNLNQQAKVFERMAKELKEKALQHTNSANAAKRASDQADQAVASAVKTLLMPATTSAPCTTFAQPDQNPIVKKDFQPGASSIKLGEKRSNGSELCSPNPFKAAKLAAEASTVHAGTASPNIPTTVQSAVHLPALGKAYMKMAPSASHPGQAAQGLLVGPQPDNSASMLTVREIERPQVTNSMANPAPGNNSELGQLRINTTNSSGEVSH